MHKSILQLWCLPEQGNSAVIGHHNCKIGEQSYGSELDDDLD